MDEKMKEALRNAREVYLNERGEPVAFCPPDSVGLTDLCRMEFYDRNRVRLNEMAEKARLRGQGDVVVCIDVDDPTWTELVDHLMPGHDWASYRARGEQPVARGIVKRQGMEEIVLAAYPAAGKFHDDGRTNVLIFAAGGVAIL